MIDSWEKRRQTYGAYRTWVANAINDSLDAGITGSETDNRIGLFNMFHLLMEMRNQKYASARPLREDIECMRDALFCDGVDTREMEKIFPASYNDKTGNEWEPYDPDDPGDGDPNRSDGVDYMAIESDGSEYPINRVR